MRRTMVIMMLTALAVGISTCKKSGSKSSLAGDALDPNDDYAPQSLEITECVENQAR